MDIRFTGMWTHTDWGYPYIDWHTYGDCICPLLCLARVVILNIEVVSPIKQVIHSLNRRLTCVCMNLSGMICVRWGGVNDYPV